MIPLVATLFKALRGYNISIHFDTLPNTIKLLGNELGHVIKQQAGIKYYKIVEEIRQKSKNPIRYYTILFKIVVDSLYNE